MHLSPLISILFPIRHRQTFTSVYIYEAIRMLMRIFFKARLCYSGIDEIFLPFYR
ncbi:hypothetical protein ROSEINA2194_03386 [Roseburia inulinivorans DSM 16841]|uniref:Uncharacterized protein n=1 Tax=Roseburia inulinivorans DSM 16841 TaxID=622312 RepID=C0FXA7_9FIRM|nr:hypothetical protein ROSEINA2194_03386 [Roseburia inulinivorans DSM 16841]